MSGDVISDDPDVALQRARSIDWRFVLSDPTPGRVALADGVPDDVRGALVDAGWREVRADADLAVVIGPTRSTLAWSSGATRAGGSIGLVWRGSLSRWRARRQLAPRRAEARLRELGFDEGRWYLLVPGSEATDAIVPLDGPAALRMLLRRRRWPWRTRVARIAAEALRRSGVLVRMAPSVALVASRRVADGPVSAGLPLGMDAASTHLACLRSEDPARPIPATHASPLLLTPRFRASRHVVALVPRSADGRPAVVVKMSRLPDEGDVAHREAAALARIADWPKALRDCAPRLVHAGAPWGLATLVETAVEGDPLDPSTVRREPDASIRAVATWLEGLARFDEPEVAGPRLSRLVDVPLETYTTAMPPRDDDRVLLDATRVAVERLRGESLPVVFEHGDVSHPNLLRRPDGSIAAVDWELAEPDGLPGHDITTFLAYVAVARAGARSPAEQGRAIASALTHPGGWAMAAGRDHLARIGVEPDLLEALTTVALARLAISQITRVRERPTGPLPADDAAWIRGHRYHIAWRALATAEWSSP